MEDQQTNADDSDNDVTSDLIRYAEFQKWHLKYAKFNREIHQSLLSHSLNVMGVSDRIFVSHKSNPDKSARYRLLLASFFHDIAKETTVYQNAVIDWLDGKRGIEPSDWEQMNPDIIRHGLKHFMNFTNRPINEKELDSIKWIIMHMAAPESVAHMQDRLTLPPFGDEIFLSEIGRLSDKVMSMRSVDEARNIRVDEAILPNLKFDYYKLGIVRGVLTQYLHRAIQRIFEQSEAIPIAWFPDGTLYSTRASLQIAIEEIKKGIRQEFNSLFTEELEEIMGESSFGSLTGSPIKSPAFLFLSERSVRGFWKRVMNMNFAKSQFSKEDLENAESKLRVYNLFLEGGMDELTARVHTSITFSSSQIVQILNSAKKLVVTSARKSEKTKKELDQELDDKITKTMTSHLECAIPTELCSISQGTPPEKRLRLFKELSDTKIFQSKESWTQHFNEGIVQSTIFLMDQWKKEVDDPLNDISLSLVDDLVKPSNIKQVMENARNLQQKYYEGKSNDGTSVCEECGNIAQVRANSPPFEKSQTYHDHLAGGQPYGRKNVINVCKLCRFERDIRSLFVNGELIILYPQLALSPSQRDYWEKIIKKFALDRIGNYDDKLGRYLPPITYLDRWAKIALEEKIPTINPHAELIDIQNQSTIMKSLSKSFEDDIDVAVSYLEEDEGFSNFKDMALALYEGRVKLSPEGLKKLNNSIVEKFIYGAPNFILVIVPNISRNKEPPSATSLRLIFLLSLLAKMFVSSASTIVSNQSIVDSSSNNGYVQIQRYPTLQNVYSQLGIKQDWVPITELDNIMMKLAGLLLTDRLLVNKNTPSYGRGQLITISSLSPGQVLNRKLQDSGHLSLPLIRYLQFWNGKDR
jgi:hypothetical protein